MRAGVLHPRTARDLDKIRRLRAKGYTLVEIAAKLGGTKQRIHHLCKRHRIPGSRAYSTDGRRHGEGKARTLRSLPPIDMRRATQITDDLRSYWLSTDKSLRAG